MAPRAVWRRVIGSSVLLQLLVGVPFVLCSYWCVPAAEVLLLLTLLAGMTALIALVAGLVLVVFRPAYGARLFVWGGVGLVIMVAAFALARHARMSTLVACTERAQPLIAAIAAFERDRGAPPPDLEALVPDYLPTLPGTGLGACPRFDYSRDPAVGTTPAPAWQLQLSCAELMDVDLFTYWPGQHYPERMFGRTVVRHGAWAFVHRD